MASAGQRQRKRERLGDKRIALEGRSPLASVGALAGVRVYDVGQGDAISVLNDRHEPVLHIDYGGRQGSPFRKLNPAQIDQYLPVESDQLVIITHWDEDHWCTAPKGTAAKGARWLVPRQVTSPRAARFAASLDRITCIREGDVGQAQRFAAASGDELWWEKIGVSEADTRRFEDCNRTGVALSLVRRRAGETDRVILIAGDAAFGRVSHYVSHFREGRLLAGVIAFHHGAGTHWTPLTEALLSEWPMVEGGAELVFSFAQPNSYQHPDRSRYDALLGGRLRRVTETPDLRAAESTFHDLLF